MRKCGRYKARGLMTLDAITVSGYMGQDRFTGDGCSIVTGGALVHDILVIEIRLSKCRRHMTNRAILSGWYMRRIRFCIHSGRSDTVVTGGAVTHNAGVIKHRCGKSTRYMTKATVFACRRMPRMLLGDRTGCSVTVTLRTIINTTGMIKYCIRETDGIMARSTVAIGCRMTGCLAQCSRSYKIRTAIVAGGALASNAIMRKSRGFKTGYRMAAIAILFGR